MRCLNLDLRTSEGSRAKVCVVWPQIGARQERVLRTLGALGTVIHLKILLSVLPLELSIFRPRFGYTNWDELNRLSRSLRARLYETRRVKTHHKGESDYGGCVFFFLPPDWSRADPTIHYRPKITVTKLDP